jgi:biopolymer transport protein ExbB
MFSLRVVLRTALLCLLVVGLIGGLAGPARAQKKDSKKAAAAAATKKEKTDDKGTKPQPAKSEPAASGKNASTDANDKLDDAARRADAALAEPANDAEAKPADATAPPAESPKPPNLFELWFWGGPLMYPITLMSFLVVIFAVERWLGTRRRRVIPPGLVKGLGQLAARVGGLDPRQAYQLCQKYPSTAANVIRSVLLKVGRPHSEVEHAVTEACEREAAKLYKNVRTINLATTITPLLGLLGTVQGMIEAFFITAHLPVGADRSEHLASGIYIALVTTFGGLVVAIPASVLAHYFEGRIQALFREIDELLLGILPQLERYEGKLRMTRQTHEQAAANPARAAEVPNEVASGRE